MTTKICRKISIYRSLIVDGEIFLAKYTIDVFIFSESSKGEAAGS